MQTPADRERIDAESKARTEGIHAFARKVAENSGDVIVGGNVGPASGRKLPRVMHKAVDFAAVTPEAHELAQARLREYRASPGSFTSAIRARSLMPIERPKSTVSSAVFDPDAIPTSAREEADHMRTLREISGREPEQPTSKILGADDIPDMPVGAGGSR